VFQNILAKAQAIRRIPQYPELLNREDVRKLYDNEACTGEARSDELGCQLEDSGRLTFELVRNDSSPRFLFMLCALKNVFRRQLPNMPATYISLLVFDPRHMSLCAKWDGSVVGGITFRPFYTPQANFAEIAFCAVYNHYDPDQRGVGARLMQRLKIECLRMKIHHFLTYADDTAIGFFKKMGFTKRIYLEHDYWKGCVKDYERATLMHCMFREGIDYTSMPDLVHVQRQCLLNLFPKHVRRPVNSNSNSTTANAGNVVNGYEYPGLTTIPPPEVSSAQLRKMHDALSKHEDCWPFLQPVSEIIAAYPNYTETVRNPLDMMIIEQRILSGTYYRTYHMFFADVILMLKNCQRFNGEGSEYTKNAARMIDYLRKLAGQEGGGREEQVDVVEKGLRYVYDPDQGKKKKKS
jgi:N-acetylglutamate synthase-like GNAT family acetyltransferase